MSIGRFFKRLFQPASTVSEPPTEKPAHQAQAETASPAVNEPAETHSDIVRRWFGDKGDTTLRVDYDLNADSIVLDLGGYEGDWAAKIHDRYGAEVHVFEPVESFAKHCEERFANNAKVHVHSRGLGGNTRVETISLSKDGSSMFPDSVESEGTETIHITDFEEWINEQEISEISLMKLNIEGGEYELLERILDLDFAKRVQDIQIQFHRIEPESEEQMKAIQQRLSRTHRLSYQYWFVWENWERLTA